MTIQAAPDWGQIFINHHYWRPEYNKFRLPVGGYLIAVGVRLADDSGGCPLVNDDPDDYHRGSFALVNESDEGRVLAGFSWAYPYNQCGVGFKEPLADVNNASAHLLWRVAPVKTEARLLITTVHLAMT